jgi:hypothetical protein
MNFDSDQDNKQEDDDDDFTNVVPDKKRGQKKPVVEAPVYDPRFPASDPTKVKVITMKDKPVKNLKPGAAG